MQISTYMKLCINLNVRAEKQNHGLTSLNYVTTIVFFVSCIKQTNYFFKSIFIFLAFTICFHKDFCIQWPSNCRRWEIILLRKRIPNGIALFQKIRAFNKFSRGQTRGLKKFFDFKRIIIIYLFTVDKKCFT